MNVRKSDVKYMRDTYGWVSKVKKAYLAVCNFIKVLSLVSTLILIPVFIGAVIYYSFFNVSPVMVIVCCASLWSVTDCNSKL